MLASHQTVSLQSRENQDEDLLVEFFPQALADLGKAGMLRRRFIQVKVKNRSSCSPTISRISSRCATDFGMRCFLRCNKLTGWRMVKHWLSDDDDEGFAFAKPV